jgi:hypothetical protein
MYQIKSQLLQIKPQYSLTEILHFLFRSDPRRNPVIGATK